MARKLKIIIALLCTLVMAVPACTFTVAADSSNGSTGKISGTVLKYIYFGSYPQKEVVSKLSDSGVYGKEWASRGDCIVDQNLYNQLENAKWDTNNDIEITDAESGEKTKYHRIKKDDATNDFNPEDDWDDEYYDRYYKWEDSDTYHYFKYEPIKWRVLEKNGDDAFLMSETALDDQKYNNSYDECTWETCSLRTWLNNTFLNRAFTEDEQDAVITTAVENKDNLEYETDGGNDTQDKVFLLSESEVSTENAVKYGFKSNGYSSDDARESVSSTYAKAMGAYSYIYDSCLGSSRWWLRSPGYNADQAGYVNCDGDVVSDGRYVESNDLTVRPALHLNLKSADLYTAEDCEVKIAADDVKLEGYDEDSDSYTFEYDGTAKEPEVEIPGLLKDTDFTVSYSNNKNPGKGKVTITGIGDFSGKIVRTFNVVLPEQSGEITRDVNYKCVYFGSYPQREVVYDEEASGVFGREWASEDDYIVDENLYDQLMTSEWNENDDAVIGNEKYHRLKESDAGKVETDDGYYNWSASDTYHYFKYEPIKWRVLDQNGKDAFLLSDIVLDNQKYDNSKGNSTWETSSLRSWLNNDFLSSAFTSNEQSAILTTAVENKGNTRWSVEGGNDTQDKVYLLSAAEINTDEALMYGFQRKHHYDEFEGYDKAAESKSSTYAKAMGVYSYDYDSCLGNSLWWLRSPGFSEEEGLAVTYYGNSDFDDSSSYKTNLHGIRPVLHLNLNDVTPKDAGNTGYLSTISADTINISTETFVYRNKPVEPVVKVEGLREGRDYEVTYSDNNKAGLATITVNGKGNWNGSITRNFVITEEIDISDRTVSLSETEYYYEGKAVCPKVKIEDLEENTDYSVTYENNNKIGIAKITVTGINGCTGTIIRKFKINKCEDHSYGEWTVTKEPGCSEKGSRTRECSRCHYKQTEETETISHDVELVEKSEHLCLPEGTKGYYQCKDCKKYFKDAEGHEEVNPAHKYVSFVIEPTCCHDGYTIHICIKCGESYKDSKVAATGQVFDQKVADEKFLKEEANCTSPAEYYLSCHCGESSEGTDSEATFTSGSEAGHNWDDGEVTKTPTSTEKGERTFHCTRKGCTETKVEEITATGQHHYTEFKAKNATCTKAGSKAYWYCSDCDKYYADSDGKNEITKGSWTVNALGHSYKTVKAGNGCTYKKCTSCGKTTSYVSPSYVKSFKLVSGKKAVTVKWKKQSKANQKKFSGYRIRYSLKANMSGAKTVCASKAAASKTISKLSAKKKYYVEICSIAKAGGKYYYSKAITKSVKTR